MSRSLHELAQRLNDLEARKNALEVASRAIRFDTSLASVRALKREHRAVCLELDRLKKRLAR